VRDDGYQWLDDHGRIVGDGDPHASPDRLSHRLRWLARDGATLLVEERTLSTRPLPTHPEAWLFELAYTLTNPNATPVVLGSPATNGRPGKAGYGGFFWRLPMTDTTPTALAPDAGTEEDVNGSAGDWVALSARDGSGTPYSLVFSGLGEGDRWFVRAAEYPGVCVALAFDRTRTIAPGEGLSRRHLVAVADGSVDRARAASLSAASVSAA
jgi:hypothetical protein